MIIYYDGKKQVDYLVHFNDYLEYTLRYESETRSGQYYVLTPKKSVYNKLKEGDYIGVETEPADEFKGIKSNRVIWFSTVEKKYKNGKILVYEA